MTSTNTRRIFTRWFAISVLTITALIGVLLAMEYLHTKTLISYGLDAQIWQRCGPQLAILWSVLIVIAGFVCRYVSINLAAQNQLHRYNALLSKLFLVTSEGVTITDARARIIAVNDAFTKITGYTPEEAIGSNPRLLSSHFHDAAFYRNMWRTLKQNDRWQGEIYNRRKDGQCIWEWLTISAAYDEHGKITNYIAVFSDITSRKAAEETLIRNAYTDALTGLNNRLALDRHLPRELARADRLGNEIGCLYLDLNRFKPINDRYGHHIGDEVLQMVARRIEHQVRTTDFVTRLGGDEFVVIMTDLSEPDAVIHLTNRIHDALLQPMLINDLHLELGCSIGSAIYPQEAESAETLLQLADKRMYEAKQATHKRQNRSKLTALESCT